MGKSKDHTDDSSTYYVLVTGANSGLGYSICERLVTEFLLTRPATQHLHLIPSTRTQAKADETVRRLQSHIESLVVGRSSQPVYFRSGSPPSESYEAKPSAEARSQFSARVSFQPVLVDLCKLSSVFECAETLRQRVPRLDVLICNAGIGGWDGVNWWGAMWQFFTEGPVSMVTRPNFKMCRVGAATQRQSVGEVKASGTDEAEEEPLLGEVFCANVFGHYLLVHACLSLLSRSVRQQEMEQARVVWIGTGEAMAKHFNVEDIQALKSSDSYEASKRLLDILILGPNVDETAEQMKQQYLVSDASSKSPKEKDMEQSLYIVSDKDLSSSPSQASINSVQSTSTIKGTVPPQMYLAHPGVCLTSIMPLNAIMIYAQLGVLYLARWLGSKWHVNTSYKGATAAVWLATESTSRLAEEDATHKKWGSMCNRWGVEGVTETYMEGYGLAGEESSGSYGDAARRLWVYMEDLRRDWTQRVRKTQ